MKKNIRPDVVLKALAPILGLNLHDKDCLDKLTLHIEDGTVKLDISYWPCEPKSVLDSDTTRVNSEEVI